LAFRLSGLVASADSIRARPGTAPAIFAPSSRAATWASGSSVEQPPAIVQSPGGLREHLRPVSIPRVFALLATTRIAEALPFGPLATVAARSGAPRGCPQCFPDLPLASGLRAAGSLGQRPIRSLIAGVRKVLPSVAAATSNKDLFSRARASLRPRPLRTCPARGGAIPVRVLVRVSAHRPGPDCRLRRAAAPGPHCGGAPQQVLVRAATLPEAIAFEPAFGLVHVAVDEPQGFASSVPAVWEATCPRLAIVRLHGDNRATWTKKRISAAERFNYLYSDVELREISGHARELGAQVGEPHLLFNDCYRDNAQRNALALQATMNR